MFVFVGLMKCEYDCVKLYVIVMNLKFCDDVYGVEILIKSGRGDVVLRFKKRILFDVRKVIRVGY